MARVYAGAADYQGYTGQTPPSDVEAKLARASTMLDSRVLRAYRYDVDTTGMPTAAVVLAAFKDATCALVQWWVETGDELGQAGQYEEVRLGTMILKGPTSTAGGTPPGRHIPATVWDILQGPDLTPDKFRAMVSTGGGSGTGWGW